MSLIIRYVAVIFVLSTALAVYSILKAPEGYEDEDGFHWA
jgi:hypothetical protein